MNQPRPWFHGLAVILLGLGVAFAFIQKQYEGRVARSVAERVASGKEDPSASESHVAELISTARRWQMTGFVVVASGLVSFGVGIWRRETHRWLRVTLRATIILSWTLYVFLELLMV